MNQFFQTSYNKETEEKGFNFVELIEPYLNFWYWFVMGIFFSIGIAWTYLHYSIPTYESKASVLFKEGQKGLDPAEMEFFSGLGLSTGENNLENEIIIFKSRTLIERVIKKLELNYTFQLIGAKSGILRNELYKESPISFDAVGHDSLFYDKSEKYQITLTNESSFQLATSEGEEIGKYGYGKIIKTYIGEFIINKTTEFTKDDLGKSVLFSVQPLDDIVTYLQQSIAVESTSKDSKVINISLKGINIEKNNDIINELIAQHKADAIEDKNEVASNTSTFINERLKFIAAELASVEDEGQDYKSKYNLVDVTSDAKSYLEKESVTDKAMTEASIQLSLAVFMNDFIRSQQGYNDVLPSNLGIKDESIAKLLEDYNDFVLERNRLLQSSSEKNPAVQKIEGKLNNLKSSIVSSLKNSSDALELLLKKLKAKENLIQSQIASVPRYEREYRDILRQQQIKETLYLFLLQKREENEITLASTVGSTKVIDVAFSNQSPVSPNKRMVYIIALLMGVFIPTGIIYLKNLLDNKVHGYKDLEKLSLPFIGDIPWGIEKEYIVSTRKAKSAIAEAFRMIRTNITFILDNNKEEAKVILITSSVSKEGKTFTAINLGHTMAYSANRTVVMSMDLRAPKLKEYLGLDEHLGITQYIINNNLTLDDLLIQSKESENLFYIISGPIPPNPSELLMRNRLKELIDDLKKQFDIIIIDTAPVGLVADTLHLNTFADLIIYIVRSNFIDKRMLLIPANLNKYNKAGKMAILINGTKRKQKTDGYGYGYGEELIESRFCRKKLNPLYWFKSKRKTDD